MAIQNITISILLFFAGFLFVPDCLAIHQETESIIVTPIIIDTKAEARDILEFEIKISNPKNSKVDIYPIVNDILTEEGKQEFLDPSLMDKSISLARWIKISRGIIELGPGEEKIIPLKIEVNLYARPGKYYAAITFAEGSNRDMAESQQLLAGQSELRINLEVEEHIIEKAQIKQFGVNKNIFLKPPVKFFLEIENIGNREITPQGFISIYNRQGEERKTLDINQLQNNILPANSDSFENYWLEKGSFGRYKAVLIMEYGNYGKRDLQDTIYFWIVPWPILIFGAGGLLVFLLALIFIILKSFYSKNTYPHLSGSRSLSEAKDSHPKPSQKIHRINKVVDLRRPEG